MLDIMAAAASNAPSTADLVMAVCSVLSVLLAVSSEFRRRKAVSEKNDVGMVQVAFDGMDNLVESMRKERTELLLEIGNKNLFIAELTRYMMSHGIAVPTQPEPLTLSDLYQEEGGSDK